MNKSKKINETAAQVYENLMGTNDLTVQPILYKAMCGNHKKRLSADTMTFFKRLIVHRHDEYMKQIEMHCLNNMIQAMYPKCFDFAVFLNREKDLIEVECVPEQYEILSYYYPILPQNFLIGFFQLVDYIDKCIVLNLDDDTCFDVTSHTDAFEFEVYTCEQHMKGLSINDLLKDEAEIDQQSNWNDDHKEKLVGRKTYYELLLAELNNRKVPEYKSMRKKVKELGRKEIEKRFDL